MLSKANRLKKTADFKKIFKEGRFIKGRMLDTRVFENKLGLCRLGFSIGLKFSKKATLRNKARRRLSEAARALLPQIKPGYDFIFIPKIKILETSQEEIIKDLKDVLYKNHFLIP